MAMIRYDDEEDQNNRVNMTPLIDLVFLLLVYFMLAMTFSPDEEWLNSLLNGGGTGKGGLLGFCNLSRSSLGNTLGALNLGLLSNALLHLSNAPRLRITNIATRSFLQIPLVFSFLRR